MQTGLTLSPVALTAYPDIDDVPLDLEPITWDSSWGGTQSSDMFSGTDSYTSSMVNATSFDSRYNLPAVSYDAMYDRQGLAESTVAPSFNSAGVTHPNIESEQQESAEQLQPEQHPDGYKCRWEGCRYKRNFRRCIELDRHVRTIHIFPRSYHCNVDRCTRSFNRKDNLKEHKIRVHKLRRSTRE
ncbi:hypothetical protein ASPWEDRAFT_188278 [Aspergillus wentii DTO 134E9]|uniref:C2H2-type domain-containing protein n=1 Tax=Aspergillus wentii DTO 134E9 TaxID=1073089 RepID=A0A1L9R4L3_ASPWE|nr:uncharacterized protein ASPWEDRAFT_188278 [Aspergillus wentii DTO 134E9]OJJ29861.1 hypothetical protein ASPWEDRAFT_188278 [Aspergillus wentii DTO 134E9]